MTTLNHSASERQELYPQGSKIGLQYNSAVKSTFDKILSIYDILPGLAPSSLFQYVEAINDQDIKTKANVEKAKGNMQV